MRRHWYAEALDKYFETENENDALKGLESELQENDEETIWVLEHYTLTASGFFSLDPDEMDGEKITRQIETAKKEIELLRKYKYYNYADREEEALKRFEAYLMK